MNAGGVPKTCKSNGAALMKFSDAASMPAGESVDSNLTFMPGKKSFKKLLTERGNAGKISICCGKRL